MPDTWPPPDLSDFEEGEIKGAAEERARLRPLLERCADLAEGLAFNRPGDPGARVALDLLADLRRELDTPA